MPSQKSSPRAGARGRRLRRPDLLARPIEVKGAPANAYEWRGEQVPVWDTAERGLRLLRMFEQGTSLPDVAALLFPCPAVLWGRTEEEAGELLAEVMWEAFGLDVTADGRRQGHERPVFDWDEDAARIRASLLSAYGMGWEEASRTTSYVDMCALLSSLLEAGETPFRQAVSFRAGTPPKRTERNREYCEWWRSMREHYALKRADADADDGMADEFAALKRLAGGD